MVTKMASGEKQVPLEQCPLIQAFTDGAVTNEELRPDKADYFALIRSQGAGPTTLSAPAVVPGENPLAGVGFNLNAVAFGDLPATVRERMRTDGG